LMRYASANAFFQVIRSVSPRQRPLPLDVSGKGSWPPD
jgi:hypothetical protein